MNSKGRCFNCAFDGSCFYQEQASVKEDIAECEHWEKKENWVDLLMAYVWVTNGQLLHNPEKMADLVEQIRNEGIESVKAIRCMKHRGSPVYNTNAAGGAECPACEIEPRGSR